MRDFKTQYMGRSDPINRLNNSIISRKWILFVTKNEKKVKNKEIVGLTSTKRLIVALKSTMKARFFARKKRREKRG